MFDFKQFKKIGSDDKTTTLRHPDGHEIKVAHSALTPKLKKQVQALPMAEGGYLSSMRREERMDKGGKQNPYSAHAENQEQPSSAQQAPEHVHDHDAVLKHGAHARYAEGSDEPVSPEDLEPDTTRSLSNQVSQGQPGGLLQQLRGGPGSPTVAQDPAQATVSGLGDLIAQVPESAPPPAPEQPQEQPSKQPSAAEKANAQIDAITQQALSPATGQQAQQAYAAQQDQQQMLMNQFMARKQELDQQHNSVIHDILNGHIDMSNYWKSNDKGAAMVGAFLGGLGSGLTHLANPVPGMIANSQENFLRSELANLDNPKSVLGAIQSQYGANQNSMDMARLVSNEMLSSKLNEISAPINSQMVQQKAAEMKMQLMSNSEQLKRQIAARQAFQDLNQPTASSPGQITPDHSAQIAQIYQADPKQAETAVDHLASTQGISANLTSYAGPENRKAYALGPNNLYWNTGSEANAKDYNERAQAFRPLMADLQDLSKLNSDPSTRLNPAARARSQTLMRRLNIELNDFAKIHRVSEADMGLQQGQLSDPTALSTILSGNAATKQIMSSLQRQMDAVNKQYIPGYRPTDYR